ncbi:MAG: NAD-dependent epimerase/dehydratase family protein [Myxococcales bacterium]|nr:NAD-dependent epimerase/dehydratase family protein [Myxococcales bacterium]
MRALVTGGCGFVGGHLVDALVARGDDVRVLDVTERTPRREVEYVRADLTDAGAVRAACEGADAVFHVASVVGTRQSQRAAMWAVNVGGTDHVLDACRAAGVRRMVYVSSGSVVYEGRDIEGGDERLPYASVSQAPYADAKIAAEKRTLAADGVGGVRTIALRPHVVFGPGDTRFLPALVRHARSGRLRVQVGRGTWLSDYTYVDNLVDALLLADAALAAGAPVGGRAYFITNGEPMPFWDFVRRVLARLGLPPIRWKAPHQLVYAAAAVRETLDRLRDDEASTEDGLTRFAIRYMCTHHYFSIEQARRALGYAPAVTVAEGIERTCRHLEATGAMHDSPTPHRPIR